MMDVKDALARLRAGLDRDEAIARAAIGKRGSEVGAVTQHWQWDLVADDEIVLTDGSAPIDVAYCYADEVEKVAGLAVLVTAERYPARVADWQLQDRLLPGVEEPHTGAAQHIARHDPARVADQHVPAIRRVLALYERYADLDVDELSGDDRIRVLAGRETLEGVLEDLASIYADPTEEPSI